MQTKHPVFVVVPQTTRGWDATGIESAAGRAAALEYGNNASPELLLVLGILDSLKSEFSIDSSRLYISGQSIGGFGAWNMITKRPDVFAAAIILCGGGNPDLAARAKNIPIWSFQGDKDGPAFVDSNRAMVTRIRDAGGIPRYKEYPGVGHNIWDLVFKEPGLVDWLFSQHK